MEFAPGPASSGLNSRQSLTLAGSVLCSLDFMLEAIKYALAGVIVVGVGRMAAADRLPRNLLVGIRIPSTMRSDEAWRAGHQAAASALTTAGMGPVVVAACVAATRPSRGAQTLLFRLGMGWLLGWIGYATVRANREARAAELA